MPATKSKKPTKRSQTPKKTRPAHDAALAALLTEQERASYESRKTALIARNVSLDTIDVGRKQTGLSKKELAARAGLEASSVRRLLAAETANPTSESTFLLFAASGVRLEAILPNGDRRAIL